MVGRNIDATQITITENTSQIVISASPLPAIISNDCAKMMDIIIKDMNAHNEVNISDFVLPSPAPNLESKRLAGSNIVAKLIAMCKNTEMKIT
jgi:hypothetical protein